MDPTLNNSNYSYNQSGMMSPYSQFGGMTPQQRQMQMNQAYGLMNYNSPVNTPMSGAGSMATNIMNGLMMNPSLSGVFNRNQQAQQGMQGGAQNAQPGQPMNLSPIVNLNQQTTPNATVSVPGQ